MEIGAHVWLRSHASQWGWVPARISDKQPILDSAGVQTVRLTLKDDPIDYQAAAASANSMRKNAGAGVGGREDELNASMSLAPNSSVWQARGPARAGSNGGGRGGNQQQPLMTDSGSFRLYTPSFDDGDGPFEVTIDIDPEQLKTADHEDVKLRNGPGTNNGSDRNINGDANGDLTCVNDLIGLTHLHEPAILHAVRVRYDQDIIYTSTGPILIAVNPFKPMPLYTEEIMESYRVQGERRMGLSLSLSSSSSFTSHDGRSTPRNNTPDPLDDNTTEKLPPHAYQIADEAYRAMMRGLENGAMMQRRNSTRRAIEAAKDGGRLNCSQSILVSGESGAGKTVTTKIVLNYFAVLSKKSSECHHQQQPPETPRVVQAASSSSMGGVTAGNGGIVLPSSAHKRRMFKLRNSPTATTVKSCSSRTMLTHADDDQDVSTPSEMEEDVTIETQVLQSNPILESFGNARTIRNDNSSRFGKYIDVHFTGDGRLTGATIETYLLEKVRLIHPGEGERNYHVFYQLLESATEQEREQFYLYERTVHDFALLAQTGTFDRRDMVSDEANHLDMLDAMITIGFTAEIIQNLMQLVVAVLFLGNMTFTSTNHDESCTLDQNDDSLAAASLLGVTFEDLSRALTNKDVVAGMEVVHVPLTCGQAMKAKEALMKAVYGAAFDFLVKRINESIRDDQAPPPPPPSTQSQSLGGRPGSLVVGPGGGGASTAPVASIGVLDIFGFESFQTNNFEQVCINYTNEALQQQFNKYVFKLEQQEYEREGILWKFISFPDNQDVLDLIDRKHTGILALLDEQCIVPQGSDEKFTRYLYRKCTSHKRFSASAAQKVVFKFSIDHYAGLVEYSTDSWLEKNKDQLPGASVKLLASSSFGLIDDIKGFLRSEERAGRGSVATKSVGAQFSAQLRTLRARIDKTMPHYIRCLKPNNDLVPHCFEPKNVVEQLRCGGVLEAVRVSRAGYPTRYGHDVFMERYYVLGEQPEQQQHQHHPHQQNKNQGIKLKDLIGQIAFLVWQAEHQMMVSLRETERALNGPKKIRKESRGRNKMNALTPPRAQIRKAIEKREINYNGMGAPETLEDYLDLDFSSRCAMAGLQLGKTKVFLRREAFDRLEALRSAKLSHASAMIQAEVRRVQYRHKFLQMKYAAIVVQSVVRMYLATKRVTWMMFDRSATTIQCMWRRVQAERLVMEEYQRLGSAAFVIQVAYRRYEERKYMLLCEQEQMEQDRIAKEMEMERERAAREAVLERERLEREALEREAALERERAEQEAAQERERAEQEAALERERVERERVEREAAEREQAEREAFEKEEHAAVAIQAVVRGASNRSLLSRSMEEEQERERERQSEYNHQHQQQRSNLHSLSEQIAPGRPNRVRGPITPREGPGFDLQEHQQHPNALDSETEAVHNELFGLLQEENWAEVEAILDKHPELAAQEEPTSGELALHVIARYSDAWTLLIDTILLLYPKALLHRDRMGALPIHHAAAHDSLGPLEIIYGAYKEGINDVDFKGRLPLHVAAEFDAVEAVKFLLEHSPEGAYTMVHRPPSDSGGGLPIHVACREFASIGVITALLSENFASAKRTDENGDLPLHLLLRCGEEVDQVAVKTLLTCFSAAVSRTDMHGDLPLAIALKHRCSLAVVTTLLVHFPNAASIPDGEGQSSLFTALQNEADDRTILGLLNHAPALATIKDEETGLLPIHMATKMHHSGLVVHSLLKLDLPIDSKEKVRAQLIPHHYSWNHVVSHTDDFYYQVVAKVLQTSTQPQVLALAHVEGPDGKIALATASPVCKHELRVMLRLFNTLEVVNQRPAYRNPASDTQIFYALRYEPPPQTVPGAFTILHEEKRDEEGGAGGASDAVEDLDDASYESGFSRRSTRSTRSYHSQLTQQTSVQDRLRAIRKERGQPVIAKLTSRSDIVERELRVRKEHSLSRNYVPAVLCVHHTVQHAAYSEAMAEPGYCITMEGADTTAENMMLDMRKNGLSFPSKSLKRIGISLLHMHEHGLVHGDFGTHNIGKFRSRWKLLGVGGSVAIGDFTDPNRGFYHPPEAIKLDRGRATLTTSKSGGTGATVASIRAECTYDIWAFGVVVYEGISKVPLSPYARRGKRDSNTGDLNKIGRWDDSSLRRALRHVDSKDEKIHDLLRRLLHPHPSQRFHTMREVLSHPYFEPKNEAKWKASSTGVAAAAPQTGTASQMMAKAEQPSRAMIPPSDSLSSELASSTVSSLSGASGTQSAFSASHNSNAKRRTLGREAPEQGPAPADRQHHPHPYSTSNSKSSSHKGTSTTNDENMVNGAYGSTITSVSSSKETQTNNNTTPKTMAKKPKFGIRNSLRPRRNKSSSKT